MRSAIQGLLGLLVALHSGCAAAPPSKRADSSAKRAAQMQLQREYAQLTVNARRIANRTVAGSELTNVIRQMCNGACEANYFDCVVHQAPPVDIPGEGRPPIPNVPEGREIPECDGPDCTPDRVPGTGGPSCESGRDACHKICECRGVPRTN